MEKLQLKVKTDLVPLQCFCECQNESCASQETNLAFPMTVKNRAFAINCALVLGFQAIGGSHVAASKVFSFLINKNCQMPIIAIAR